MSQEEGQDKKLIKSATFQPPPKKGADKEKKGEPEKPKMPVAVDGSDGSVKPETGGEPEKPKKSHTTGTPEDVDQGDSSRWSGAGAGQTLGEYSGKMRDLADTYEATLKLELPEVDKLHLAGIAFLRMQLAEAGFTLDDWDIDYYRLDPDKLVRRMAMDLKTIQSIREFEAPSVFYFLKAIAASSPLAVNYVESIAPQERDMLCENILNKFIVMYVDDNRTSPAVIKNIMGQMLKKEAEDRHNIKFDLDQQSGEKKQLFTIGDGSGGRLDRFCASLERSMSRESSGERSKSLDLPRKEKVKVRPSHSAKKQLRFEGSEDSPPGKKKYRMGADLDLAKLTKSFEDLAEQFSRANINPLSGETRTLPKRKTSKYSLKPAEKMSWTRLGSSGTQSSEQVEISPLPQSSDQQGRDGGRGHARDRVRPGRVAIPGDPGDSDPSSSSSSDSDSDAGRGGPGDSSSDNSTDTEMESDDDDDDEDDVDGDGIRKIRSKIRKWRRRVRMMSFQQDATTFAEYLQVVGPIPGRFPRDDEVDRNIHLDTRSHHEPEKKRLYIIMSRLADAKHRYDYRRTNAVMLEKQYNPDTVLTNAQWRELVEYRRDILYESLVIKYLNKQKRDLKKVTRGYNKRLKMPEDLEGMRDTRRMEIFRDIRKLITPVRQAGDGMDSLTVAWDKLRSIGRMNNFSHSNYKEALPYILEGEMGMVYTKLAKKSLKEILERLQSLVSDDSFAMAQRKLATFARKPMERFSKMIARAEILLSETQCLRPQEENRYFRRNFLLTLIFDGSAPAAAKAAKASYNQSLMEGSKVDIEELIRQAQRTEDDTFYINERAIAIKMSSLPMQGGLGKTQAMHTHTAFAMEDGDDSVDNYNYKSREPLTRTLRQKNRSENWDRMKARRSEQRDSRRPGMDASAMVLTKGKPVETPKFANNFSRKESARIPWQETRSKKSNSGEHPKKWKNAQPNSGSYHWQVPPTYADLDSEWPPLSSAPAPAPRWHPQQENHYATPPPSYQYRGSFQRGGRAQRGSYRGRPQYGNYQNYGGQTHQGFSYAWAPYQVQSVPSSASHMVIDPVGNKFISEVQLKRNQGAWQKQGFRGRRGGQQGQFARNFNANIADQDGTEGEKQKGFSRKKKKGGNQDGNNAVSKDE